MVYWTMPLTEWLTGLFARGVSVSLGLAVVSGGYAGGLRIVDVSDRSSPVEVIFVQTTGIVSSAFISGQHAFVADGLNLLIIDLGRR